MPPSLPKGTQRTITLDKPALGGGQVTVGGIVNIKVTEKANIFTLDAVAYGNTRVIFYADPKRLEVIASYEIEVPSPPPAIDRCRRRDVFTHLAVGEQLGGSCIR